LSDYASYELFILPFLYLSNYQVLIMAEESQDDFKDSLDVTSDSFDPLAAIYSNECVPDPSAPVLNNVEAFISKYSGRGRGQPQKKRTEIQPGVSKPQRQFTKEQMPVPGKNKYKEKTLVAYMEKQKEGPMSVLQSCIEKGQRVKVTVRKLDGVRGTCIGFLVAFDKHWNLALVDVDETYNRLRYRRSEADATADDLASLSLRQSESKESVGASVIRVIKTRRNTELCKRFVPQVVLRGEHVAMINPLH
jgi:small nuclear ribonucleoprotein (snRNP)-like protein